MTNGSPGTFRALDDQQQLTVRRFRGEVESRVASERSFDAAERIDREDESTLVTWFSAGPHLWYELAVRPFLPQIRVGIVTDDPDRSRDFEHMIDACGLTRQEFVQLGFKAAGLRWHEPPVEHYRDHREHFYFATPVDLTCLDALASERTIAQACTMLRGYHLAFSGEVV